MEPLRAAPHTQDVNLRRVPTKPPPFSLADLKNAVPAKCFQRSTLYSCTYLAADVLVIALLVYLSTGIDRLACPPALRWLLLWPLYWFWCGAFATGVWVVAHECGHGAFSDHKWVNDGVGLLFHSMLLVPYFSWKHSHRRHHSNTANIAKDEVFVPKSKAFGEEDAPWRQSAVWRAVNIGFTLIIGWPLYLLVNAAGRPYPRWANHFNPYSPIFSKRERMEIVVSDISLAVAIIALGLLGRSFGWIWLIKTYVIPYLLVNHWLVLITLLQHTHPGLPHYTDEEWDWLRGAMGTVDRSFGVLDTVFHHIADTHVVHHLFSKMPHYHAQEASKAIKKVLGKYYKSDSRNVYRALWEDWKMCQYVAPETEGSGILWYKG